MIYWRRINIGDWQFYAEIANIKSAILFQSEHAQWHVAQNCQYKIRQLTFHRQIWQILLSPINHLVQYNMNTIYVHRLHHSNLVNTDTQCLWPKINK